MTFGIISAGVEGGLRLTVDLNLDDPNADGKLRIEEIADELANPICLFDVEGKLRAFLAAYFKLDLKFFSKKWRFVLANVTLLDFSKSCDPPNPRPASTEATPQGPALRIHVGPQAFMRGFQLEEDDEFEFEDRGWLARKLEKRIRSELLKEIQADPDLDYRDLEDTVKDLVDEFLPEFVEED